MVTDVFWIGFFKATAFETQEGATHPELQLLRRKVDEGGDTTKRGRFTAILLPNKDDLKMSLRRCSIREVR
jgi:hypothetical protein